MTALPLLVILGPTASGKTKLAVALASELHGEIISADSRQVFSDMDIGTGKDLMDYFIEGKNIPYHLINIKAAGETYNVNAFKDDFYIAFNQITGKKKLPILCGGTGMYIHSLLQQHELTAIPPNEQLRLSLKTLSKDQLIDRLILYPAKLRENVDYSSTKRIIRAIEIAEYLTEKPLEKKILPKMKPFVVGLKHSLETRRSRILQRLELRLKNGLVEEVEMLIKKGVSIEMLTFYGLEYKFVAAHLSGEIDFTELKERLGIAICQFAKRQMTFFRKMEKDGIEIHWLNAEMDIAALKETVINWLANKSDSN
jgi:tRNA dimethylallyltransferase